MRVGFAVPATPALLSLLVVGCALGTGLGCATTSKGPQSMAVRKVAAIDDPYLWLEEIEGARSLSWVKAHNDKSVPYLSGLPAYKKFEPEIRNIALAKDRIPAVDQHGKWLYNFWQDEVHVRGIWRRTSLVEYEKADPAWELLLDLDALAKAENENWVYKGAVCRAPEGERCMLALSRGGKDAVVYREFDVEKKSFVKDGFELPEAKTDVAWRDPETLWVGTDFGPGTLTKSGYPRQVKLWKRGTPLTSAKLVFEGTEDDLSVSGYTTQNLTGQWSFVEKSLGFFDREIYSVGPDFKLKKLPFPSGAEFWGLFQDRLIFKLRDNWMLSGGRQLKGGSVIALPASSPGLNGDPAALESGIEEIFVPSERIAVAGGACASDAFYMTVMENVKGRVFRMTPQAPGQPWKGVQLDLPDNGEISITSSDPFRPEVLIGYESFLVPPSVYLTGGAAGLPLKKVKQLQERFRAKGMVTRQFEATSKDGTRIPYFVISKDSRPKGPRPTVLYGYGGFNISETPFYLSTIGKVWVERGGVYVLANIRGGGEFGPAWHDAALKENRQRAYDDFIAVGEDLISRGITSKDKLGIQGGSNGGLLMGAVTMQRPELFKAVVCQVPLLDMMRYHKLLAGYSWMAEYGDPDDPKMAQIILKYSPYQNIHPDWNYPKIFFMTSTKDDRVHPGHARKMVARMEEQGHEVLYYENTEGGHGAAANLEQRIKNTALYFSYFAERLGLPLD